MLGLLFDGIVALAPLSGYISQLNMIKQQKSLGSFSIYVCAILMISAILRIFFWFGEGYALNLLFQAIFMVILQALLLKQCVELSPRPKDLKQKEKFWNWNTFDQYVRFLVGMTAVTTVLTLISVIFKLQWFSSILGFLSLSIEATLGVPQMYSNWKTKSIKGLSLFLIFTWFAGDLFKTIYFIKESQPMQFVMCGTIQIIVDLIIVIQIIMYRKDNKEGIPSEQKQKERLK